MQETKLIEIGVVLCWEVGVKGVELRNVVLVSAWDHVGL